MPFPSSTQGNSTWRQEQRAFREGQNLLEQSKASAAAALARAKGQGLLDHRGNLKSGFQSNNPFVNPRQYIQNLNNVVKGGQSPYTQRSHLTPLGMSRNQMGFMGGGGGTAGPTGFTAVVQPGAKAGQTVNPRMSGSFNMNKVGFGGSQVGIPTNIPGMQTGFNMSSNPMNKSHIFNSAV